MQAPIRYVGKIVKVDRKMKDIVLLDIQCVTPDTIDFVPGQFINIEIAEGVYRPYNICSAKTKTNEFSIVVNTSRPGQGTEFFLKVGVDDTISFIGPSGRFNFHTPGNKKLLFIATSSGIAPFISIIQNNVTKFPNNMFNLLFGVRTKEDVLFHDWLKQMSENKNFTYKICLSGEKSINNNNFYLGRVTKLLENVAVDGADYYICGSPEMVEDAKRIINTKRFDNISIYTEN